MEQVVGTRKPALDNMPAACCNRRGFSAEKRVHFGPPHKKSKWKIWGFSSAGRAPALQAGGQRFDPANLHHFQEIDWNRSESWDFIESLKRLEDAPWKLNIVIMMQLWEGNSKG